MPVNVTDVSDDAKNIDTFMNEVLTRLEASMKFSMPLRQTVLHFGSPVVTVSKQCSLAQIYLERQETRSRSPSLQ